MTTLITVSNSDGIVGRCDEKCHDATGPVCTCICGGSNHGCGFEVAQENVNEDYLGERRIEDWAKKHDVDLERLKVFKAPKQEKLL